MNLILIAFLISFLFGIILSPLILKLCKKLKASQTILHYVEAHKGKQGTPTMGGFIFIVSAILTALFVFKKDSSLALISLLSMLSFGTLGFLDDFIKVHYKQNMGLRAYQKIIGQVGISALLTLFAYYSYSVGTSVLIPFSNVQLDLAWGYIPFTIFVFLAVTNSVNLLDGLDGLAGGVSFVYILGFLIIFGVFIISGYNTALILEQQNLIVAGACVLGGLLAFLILNVHPAKIFMGDTGSLALGGFISALGIFSKMTLYIPILGLIFVLTALSDIIQVLHFKRTKRRVFLMAPLHHHFEKKGMNENKIVFVYIVITIILFAITFLALNFSVR